MEVAGPDHVGLGSDFDGKIVPPAGLEDVGALPRLRHLLCRRGLNETELDAIWGGNVFRVLAGADARFTRDEHSTL